jgi:ParB family transcriptional regulator, chromosome partitioning protein
MTSGAKGAKLEQVRVDQVEKNPENPRIHFRQKEMDELMASIAVHGIQVPISVYRERGRFVLIDGERRWRCALKLNLPTVPALVQEKPDRLNNLLLMFNIHALREQWDLLTIAMKLASVIELLERSKGTRPTEAEISRQTGLARGVIRRCRLLLELPQEFQRHLDEELKKPKREQRLTEDFFIEMERALKTVERAVPAVIDNKNRVRRVLIAKFKSGVIENRVHFRNVARIARADETLVKREDASAALEKLFTRNDYSIQQAYEDTVEDSYAGRELSTRISGIVKRLRGIKPESLDQNSRRELRELVAVARKLLGSGA